MEETKKKLKKSEADAIVRSTVDAVMSRGVQHAISNVSRIAGSDAKSEKLIKLETALNNIRKRATVDIETATRRYLDNV